VSEPMLPEFSVQVLTSRKCASAPVEVEMPEGLGVLDADPWTVLLPVPVQLGRGQIIALHRSGDLAGASTLSISGTWWNRRFAWRRVSAWPMLCALLRDLKPIQAPRNQ